MNKQTQIIVSLTSYPKRIKDVDKVIRTLLIQTRKPDKIILWLSQEEFPNRNEDIPRQLLDLCKYGLQICWTNDDLKSHKKYFYAMKEYPDDIIITVDDDFYYSPELIEHLLDSYIIHPRAVSCAIANLIDKKNENELSSYQNWEKNYTYCADVEVMDLLAVGCGGILYPPGCFDLEVLCDKESIQKYCLFQDDLWLKMNEVMANIPTVLVKKYQRLPALVLDGTQENALCTGINVSGNDVALKNLDVYLEMHKSHSFAELIYFGPYTVDNWLKQKKMRIKKIVEESTSFKIYIYGAGGGAKSTYGCLKCMKMEKWIKGFVVTQMEQNPLTLYNLPVIEIDSMKELDCMVIVSTADKLQKDIVIALKERGYMHILSVNNSMINEYNYAQKKMKNIQNDFLTFCKIE